MRLEKASYKAIKYAVMAWHYSKSVPLSQCAFSVFNDKNEWCGVIIYSIGANNSIARPYNLTQGRVCELVRVALNGSQESTSKAIAISLKLLKTLNPLVRLVVSYADPYQNHIGIIYQATNWIYEGRMGTNPDEYILDGKRYHGRSFRKKFGSHIPFINNGLEIVKGSDKHKYIYPLDKKLIPLCQSLSKPYPKKQHAEIAQGSAAAYQVAGDSRPDLSAQKCEVNVNG